MKNAIMLSACFFMALGCQTLNKNKDGAITDNVPKDLINGKIFASVNLEAKSGSNAHGKAWLTQSENGFQVVVSVANVTPGMHGIHFHEKGDCSAPDASSAGAHFNPTKMTHGAPNPHAHHIGDLGNIEINEDGTGVLNLVIDKTVFHPAFPNWSTLVGKSLVLHKNPDDLKSQPAGDSGDRIACGIVAKE